MSSQECLSSLLKVSNVTTLQDKLVKKKVAYNIVFFVSLIWFFRKMRPLQKIQECIILQNHDDGLKWYNIHTSFFNYLQLCVQFPFPLSYSFLFLPEECFLISCFVHSVCSPLTNIVRCSLISAKDWLSDLCSVVLLEYTNEIKFKFRYCRNF